MVVRRGWFEEMVATVVPRKQAYLPVVWSGCYGSDGTSFPASERAPSGKAAHGWWRTTGTGMVAAALEDIVRAGGYGADFAYRWEYGTEDWGLEHRLRRIVKTYRRYSPYLLHPHHSQNRNWKGSVDGQRVRAVVL